jgi:hypothetical protein
MAQCAVGLLFSWSWPAADRLPLGERGEIGHWRSAGYSGIMGSRRN